MDAIILAAGRGMRLASTHQLPKGFLEVGSLPIIVQSIHTLWDFGIRRIHLITGHDAERYDHLASGMEGVSTVFNHQYATAGNLHTLYCATEIVSGAFLLLESDLLYEPRALEALISHNSPNAILLSGRTDHGDEVYVETDAGRLKNLSKSRSLQSVATGEFVGISKLSRDLFECMQAKITRARAASSNLAYEDGLVAAGADIPIACPVVDDLIWCEIDDPSHCAIAKEKIYPRLQSARAADQSTNHCGPGQRRR
ncbi:MAG: phosphocholine cytidylyltransferase family protein [Verrucomicrobia bacterium]|nr:phosphocholine cytidylyltransferase family protein [Verrucomicrobiota bacterium]